MTTPHYRDRILTPYRLQTCSVPPAGETLLSARMQAEVLNVSQNRNSPPLSSHIYPSCVILQAELRDVSRKRFHSSRGVTVMTHFIIFPSILTIADHPRPLICIQASTRWSPEF